MYLSSTWFFRHCRTCPLCRAKIQSQALNFSLQQLILSLSAKNKELSKTASSPKKSDAKTLTEALSGEHATEVQKYWSEFRMYSLRCKVQLHCGFASLMWFVSFRCCQTRLLISRRVCQRFSAMALAHSVWLWLKCVCVTVCAAGSRQTGGRARGDSPQRRRGAAAGSSHLLCPSLSMLLHVHVLLLLAVS